MNYKIKIKRFVESLEPYEIQELTDYLLMKKSININNWSLEEIAKKIANRELPETKGWLSMADEEGLTVAHWLAYKTNWKTDDKNILMLRNNRGVSVAHILPITNKNWTTKDKKILMLKEEDGISVAHVLARYNPKWMTNDKKILMLKDKDGESVAHLLARYNLNWITKDKKILMLQDKYGESVAHALARYNPKWTTNNKKILMLKDKDNQSVAHELAYNSDKTNWTIENKEIIMLQDIYGWSVAHLLAYHHPTWTTDDQDILKLITKTGKTVEDLLKKRGKI